MRHAPYVRAPSPHTPVKPRGSALIPIVTPQPLPGQAVVTSGSSLGSIDCTHRSTLVFSPHFILTHAHPGELPGWSPIPKLRYESSTLNPQVLWGGLPEKKMHLIDMSILSLLLSLGPGSHNHPPLEDRRPRRSTPSQELFPLGHVCVSSAGIYAMPCDHSGSTCAMRHMSAPLAHTRP